MSRGECAWECQRRASQDAAPWRILQPQDIPWMPDWTQMTSLTSSVGLQGVFSLANSPPISPDLLLLLLLSMRRFSSQKRTLFRKGKRMADVACRRSESRPGEKGSTVMCLGCLTRAGGPGNGQGPTPSPSPTLRRCWVRRSLVLNGGWWPEMTLHYLLSLQSSGPPSFNYFSLSLSLFFCRFESKFLFYVIYYLRSRNFGGQVRNEKTSNGGGERLFRSFK